MFDHAMYLYPIPDVIVFCDETTKPFEISQLDCMCVSPVSIQNFNVSPAYSLIFKVWFLPFQLKITDVIFKFLLL